jgi:hypothetical protein
MGRLRRFLNLERARPDDDGGGERSTKAHLEDRFGAVGLPAPTGPDGAAPAEVGDIASAVRPAAVDGRFAPPADDGGTLELDDGDAPAEVRCLACGATGGRFASRCAACGADLTSRAQRRFNRRMWDETGAAIKRQQSERVSARHEEVEAMVRDRRARMSEEVEDAFARAVARERSRRRPPLVRLADRLTVGPLGTWSPRARLAVVVAALAVPLIALQAASGGGVRFVQLVLLVVLVGGLFRAPR